MDRIALTADEQAHWRRIAWRWKLERGVYGARFSRVEAARLIFLATLIDAGDYADDRAPAAEDAST
jgi:hypothetical protein